LYTYQKFDFHFHENPNVIIYFHLT